MVVDSKHQQLSNEEIFSIAAQETGSPYSPEQVLAAITAEAQEPGVILMREGNTIMIAHRYKKDETIAVIRTLNADTPDNFLQNCLVFKDALMSMGFRAIVTTFYDESLLSIFKYIGRGAGPGMGFQASRLPDGQIKVVAQMTPKNQGGLTSAKGIA